MKKGLLLLLLIVSLTIPGFAQPAGTSVPTILWLKADQDVFEDNNTFLSGTDVAEDGDPVNSWADQSGAMTNAATSQQLGTPPTFLSNGINYHPAIEFDGIDDGLDFANDYVLSTGTGLVMYAILQPDDNASKRRAFVFDQGGFSTTSFGFTFGSDYYMYNSPTNFGGVQRDFGPLASQVLNQTLVGIDYIFGNRQELRLNGEIIDNTSITLAGLTSTEVSATPDHAPTPGPVTIGQQSKSARISFDGGRRFDGKLAELIIIDDQLSVTERQKIESYLALKYGVTLDNTIPYVNSSGLDIWPADGTYDTDIIGLARDAAGGLFQKQSKTTDDSTRIYVSTLAVTNATNAGSITNDLSSIVLGHNGAELFVTIPNVSEKPTAAGARIAREWKVVNTNFSDNFNLDIKLAANDGLNAIDPTRLSLLIDDDGDFSNATVQTAGLTFSNNSGVITISGISTSMIPSGATRYLTLGYEIDFTIDAIASTNVDENDTYTSVTPALSGDAPIGTITYTLGGTDAAEFTIDGSTGVVSMVARDFESPEDANTDNVYEVTIVATDEAGNNDTEDWTVTVQDIDEPGGLSQPLLLWLKADQGVFEDNNTFLAGTDATEDGDPVNSWA
ncbi:MAG: hypothetical protein AAGA66_16755, partial [Bacteroidota bacterium]